MSQAATRPPTTEEKAKWTAEAAAADALAEMNRELARKARIEADDLQIDLDREQENRVRQLAADEHHRVYRFNEQVGDGSVKTCMTKLAEWHRIDPGCAMTIVFCSPGGAVIAGMSLFDYVQELRRAGHHVTTKALGVAASMAGILLQAGDVRVMARESWLLIHEGSFGAVGSVGEVEDTVEWVKRIGARILDIFADRAKSSGAEKPLTRGQIKSRSQRRDWWISSDEALKWGLIDEVE